MDVKLLLVKAATLLVRESQLENNNTPSVDLVRTVLESVKIPEVAIGVNSDREIIKNLITTILEMCTNPPDYEYDKGLLLQRIHMNCGEDDRLYSAFETGISDEINQNSLLRSINAIKKSIHTHFREQKLDEELNRAAYEFRFKRQNIKNVAEFVQNLTTTLVPLSEGSSSKDPAIIEEIDFSNPDEVKKVLIEAIEDSNSDGGFITGWQDINTMAQGCLRRGETIVPQALQHGYKTGWSLSIFGDCARFNVPKLIDPNKKPLLLRISFEDKLSANVEFLYTKFKYEETREHVSIKGIPPEEMRDYVISVMTATGFHIKMIYMDPTQSTYLSVINKVLEYEAEGYEVQLCMLDYMYKIPTTGCYNTGPMGTDIRDMLRRFRNFFKARKCTFFTPHQLSTEAKKLFRICPAPEDFVKDLPDKGMSAGSAQLDNDIDLEFFLQKVLHNGRYYLTIQRGKHRLPTIITEAEKYTIYQFPTKMPIPADINGPNSGMKKLPRFDGDSSDSLFTFG